MLTKIGVLRCFYSSILATPLFFHILDGAFGSINTFGFDEVPLINYILVSSLFFFLFMATPAVYGSSQARGQIRGAAVTHATTTATQDLSCFRDLHHSLHQYWVLNPLTEQGQGSNSHPHRHNIRSPTC